MRELYNEENFAEKFKNVAKEAGKEALKFTKVVESINAARFAKSVADFIAADAYAMQGIAIGMAAPGLSGGIQVFGKTLFLAGSTSAKILSSSFAVLGIATGIWDIIDGVKDINGSAHATAYRDSAKQIKDNVNNTDKLLKSFKN